MTRKQTKDPLPEKHSKLSGQAQYCREARHMSTSPEGRTPLAGRRRGIERRMEAKVEGEDSSRKSRSLCIGGNHSRTWILGPSVFQA